MSERKIPKILYTLLITILILNVSGCSFFESSEDKAERLYNTGIQAVSDNKSDEAIIHFKNAIQKNPRHARAHLQLGIIYLKANKLYEAATELNTAISHDPSLIEAKLKLSVLLYKNGAFESALPLLRKLVEEDPKNLNVLVMLGNSLANTGSYDDAESIFRKAIEFYPDNVNLKLFLGRTLFLNKKTKDARNIYENVSAEYPTSIIPQIILGRFYSAIKLNKEADNLFSQIITRFPDNPVSYISYARYYIERKQYQNAEDIISVAISRDIKDHNIYSNLALVQHYQKKYSAALESFKYGANISQDQKSLMLLADYYVFLKQYPEARKTYEKILSQWPELTPIKSKITEILIAENKDELALQNINEILDQEPDYARAHILKGVLERKGGMKEQAKESFLKARTLDPNSSDVHYYYGLSLLDEQDFRMSTAEIIEALAKNPNSTKARLALAYIYFRTGKLNEADNEVSNIIRIEPNNLRARFLRGTLKLSKKEFNAAETDYSFILKRNPEAFFVKFSLANVHEAQGKLDLAIDEYRKLLPRYPEPIKPLTRIVRILVSKKDFKNALSTVNNEISKKPDDTRIGVLKAAVLISQNRRQDAVRFLNELISSNPEAEQPLMLLGRLNFKDGSYEKAVYYYQKSIDINPENIEVLKELARTYYTIGNYSAAIDTYERLLKFSNTSASALNDLAYLYTEVDKKLDRALELAKSAKKLMPTSPDICDTLGWVYFKKGAPSLALNFFEEAITIEPGRPLFHFHLASARFAMEDYSMSKIEFLKSIEIGLKGKELKYAREKLKTISNRLAQRDAYKEVIHGHLDNNDYDKALECALDELNKEPDNAEIMYLTALSYLGMGSTSMANKYLNDALYIEPNNPVFNLYLGITYYRSGNTDEALVLLRKAEKIGLNEEDQKTAEGIIRKIAKETS